MSAPLLSIAKRQQEIRRGRCARERVARRRGRRILRTARAVGLRQDHADALHRGFRIAGRRSDYIERRRSFRRAALSATGEHDVPVLCAVSASRCFRKHRLRSAPAGRDESRDRRARRRIARDDAAFGLWPSKNRRAVGRTEAARRAGAGARAAPQNAAARRAARRARSQAARGDAVSAQGNPTADADELRHRHP